MSPPSPARGLGVSTGCAQSANSQLSTTSSLQCSLLFSSVYDYHLFLHWSVDEAETSVRQRNSASTTQQRIQPPIGVYDIPYFLKAVYLCWVSTGESISPDTSQRTTGTSRGKHILLTMRRRQRQTTTTALSESKQERERERDWDNKRLWRAWIATHANGTKGEYGVHMDHADQLGKKVDCTEGGT